MDDCFFLDPYSGKTDEEILASLPIPMNWGLTRRGHSYFSYLLRCYNELNFDKCYAVQNIVMMLAMVFEMSFDDNGMLYGIGLLNFCLGRLNNFHYERQFANVFSCILHFTKCFLNYKVERYDQAEEDYNIGMMMWLELSRFGHLSEIDGVKALMLYELRTAKSVEEARLILNQVRKCGIGSWFWNFIYLRVIRYKREMKKGLGFISKNERFLLLKLIRNASNSIEMLRLVVLYRRSFVQLKKIVRYNKALIDSEEFRHRMFLFKELMYSFNHNPMIGIFILNFEELPIPYSRRETSELIRYMRIRCQNMQTPDKKHIINYLRGLSLEASCPVYALRCYELSTINLPNFDSDVHAMILRVALRQMPDPIEELKILLCRYHRTDHQMIVLLNLAYHYYVDRRDFGWAVWYWFAALQVDPHSQLLKTFRPIFTRETLRCIWNVRNFAMRVSSQMPLTRLTFITVYCASENGRNVEISEMREDDDNAVNGGKLELTEIKGDDVDNAVNGGKLELTEIKRDDVDNAVNGGKLELTEIKEDDDEDDDEDDEVDNDNDDDENDNDEGNKNSEK